MTRAASTRVAVVGAGYWGINHVRTFAQGGFAELTWVCDSSEGALERAAVQAPSARKCSEIDLILGADDVDAVVLATPAVTHADLVCRALDAGKHVLVEKPLSLDLDGLTRVEQAAAASDRTLMVGHLMLYHPAVDLLHQLITSGQLGDIYYVYASRVNLGRLRSDENALWNFAPHDVSMIDFLLDRAPESVTARGQSYLQEGVEDVVFLNLRFATGQMAQVHLSWLDPHKERRLTVVGSRKMAVFDDTSSEKVRIYDKGYDRPPGFTKFDEYLTIRQGDIHIPHLRMTEPLALECRHFVECIRTGAPPRTDLASAKRVVHVLLAAQRSLERDGAPVSLPPLG